MKPVTEEGRETAMVKHIMLRAHNLVLLSVIPLLYGCQGGGGSSASLGSLLGDIPGGGGDSTVVASVTTDSLATVHQPEPATLLLIGSGIVALSYMKSRAQNSR